MSNLSSLGISKNKAIEIITKHLNQNADVLIGIDDPEINLLVDVIVEGVAEAIEANNEEIKNDIENMLKI